MSDLFSADLIPPFLLEVEVLEIEDLPLQVCLLTLELGEQRRRIEAMEHNLSCLILAGTNERK